MEAILNMLEPFWLKFIFGATAPGSWMRPPLRPRPPSGPPPAHLLASGPRPPNPQEAEHVEVEAECQAAAEQDPHEANEAQVEVKAEQDPHEVNEAPVEVKAAQDPHKVKAERDPHEVKDEAQFDHSEMLAAVEAERVSDSKRTLETDRIQDWFANQRRRLEKWVDRNEEMLAFRDDMTRALNLEVERRRMHRLELESRRSEKRKVKLEPS